MVLLLHMTRRILRKKKINILIQFSYFIGSLSNFNDGDGRIIWVC